MTSFTPARTRSNAQSSLLSHRLFHIRASAFNPLPSPLLTFPSFSVHRTPPPDSSFTSVWLPVGSSHGEMYERGEKWMANSIKSIIPEAAPCYQWHCKGVLMHCLACSALPPPHSLRNQSCCGPGGVGGGRDKLHRLIRDQRGLVSAGRRTAASRLPSPQGTAVTAVRKSSVRCQRHAQRRRKPYQQQLSRRHHTIVPPMNVIFDVYMILGINYM